MKSPFSRVPRVAKRSVALVLAFLPGCFGAAAARPPVILLNGYQASCDTLADSTATFGAMQQLLAAQGLTVYFFDNCSVHAESGGRANIETVAQSFGRFVSSLNVPQVDVVAHSMGGLIVRAYLAGMLPSGGFSPPANPRIRKAILIGTPNYGAIALAFLLASPPVDAQLSELLPGSTFQWLLNTGNQGSFDFRGVDTIAVAGNNAGTSDAPGTSDGAVPVSSAGLAGFFSPERTRVIHACHVPFLPSFVCAGPGIAFVDAETHEGYRIVNSFLAGGSEWLSIGRSAAQDPVLSKYGGIVLATADSNGNLVRTATSVTAAQGPLVGHPSTGIFFGDLLPRGLYDFVISGAASGIPSRQSFHAVPGVYVPLLVKQGPRMDGILSSTGPLATLSRAPGMLVSIYGAGLQGASLTVGGQPATILFNGDSQINAVLPEALDGVVTARVTSAQGSHSVNLFIAAAAPALFTADGSGAGAALALHSDGALVTSAYPAVPGETISLCATGLGRAPVPLPSATIGGVPATVASVTRTAPGLDLVSVVIPVQPASSAVITLASAGNTSNAVTLPVARAE